MCLLVLAWRCHPQYRVVAAANRDEYHARAAAPLAAWDDLPAVAGGRDLEAHGTWFAVDRGRRFGMVTNFREFGRRRRSAPSRGALIPAYLAGEVPPAEYLAALETDAPGYAGFSLLLGDGTSLWYACNRADVFARELPPGVYGLSNEFLDSPWPKLIRVRQRFEALLASPAAADRTALAAGMLDMLADREVPPIPPSSDATPAGLTPERARRLAAPFVLDETYGTRCSTVLTVSSAGSLALVERRFDAHGAVAGETEYLLNDTDT